MINFDLEDCDKILRVEVDNISPENIAGIVTAHNYLCIALECIDPSFKALVKSPYS